MNPYTRLTLHVAALTVMSSLSLFAQSAKELIQFSDSFTPNPSPLWNNKAGNWAAVAGRYYAQASNDSPLTYTGLPFVVTDYTLTVTTVIGDGGIWLRSNENSPYGYYLLLVLGGDNYGQGARGGEAGTSLYFTTSPQNAFDQVDNVFTPGIAYTITVTAKGNTYSVYINGATTPVATYVDTKLQFPYGQVGLYDDQPNTTSGGFGLPTTFSNFSLSAIERPPVITWFSPTAAKSGSTVTIRGTNLQQATAVTFNGTPAQFTQLYPSMDIVATVPAAATTGPIEVLTPLGATDVFTVLP